ncbi:hypothetical protein V7077_23965, partial [Neobacillus vireti]
MRGYKSLVVMLLFILGTFSLTVVKPYSANAASITTLSSGVAVNGALTLNGLNAYQFTTNKDGEAYIALDQTTGGFRMSLYDANGNYINDRVSYTAGDDTFLYLKLKQGTYNVKISSYNWNGISNATYRLKATFPGIITRDPVTFEPNDTIETAMSMISGKTYTSESSSIIDQDLYQFTTNKDGEAYIALDQTTGGF